MNVVLTGILGYVLLQLLIGFHVSRRVRTQDDYLLAGRSLGYGLATFSIFATWFGAESCIGTAGAAYADGLAGVTADPFGYAACLLLMGLVFAVPLWKMNITTIADAFRIRFSVSVERIVAIIMIPTSLLWAAAQIRAFGQVLTVSSEMTLTLAISLAAGVVILYTAAGGLLADAYTDVLQGIVIIIGLGVLAPVVFGEGDSWSGIFSSIAPERLSFVPSGGDSGSIRSTFRVMEAWAIPICGSIIAQEVVSRVLASRSPAVARRSSLMAGVVYLCAGMIPLSLGLYGSVLQPGLEDPEQILPTLARTFFPEGLYIIFAGALVSAILSTVDSALLAASALLSHNLLLRDRPVQERRRLLVNRLGVFGMGIFAYLLALHAEGVYALVKDASSFGSAGIFVAFIFGMFTPIGGRRSATSALILGAITWFAAHYVFHFEFSYVLALGVSLLAYMITAGIEKVLMNTEPVLEQPLGEQEKQ